MKKLVTLFVTMGLLVCNVAAAADIDARVIKKGIYGEVSTITGNGTASQGTYSTDHPRFPVSDGKGNVYFLDGDQKKTKLRMWNGKRNTTIVDMAKNPVTQRAGEYYTAGLAIAKGNVYFALKDKAYKYSNSKVTELTAITKFMKAHEYHYIYRMETSNKNLAFMFWSKQSGGTYGFALYDVQSGSIEELLPQGYYGNPTNFELLPEGVAVSTNNGEIYYEQFFPRKSFTVVSTNEGPILDVWADSDRTFYYSLLKNKTKPVVREIPRGEPAADYLDPVFGSIAGYRDGVGEEVEMAYPTDFSWDGSGYIFSDRENNSIRKVWIDNKPLSLVY